jgi:DNA-binding transcriptional ArsR family regulator
MIHAFGFVCVAKGRRDYPGGLASKLGMKSQAVSNQLQRLSDRGIVQTLRDGNNVIYGIVDPCVIELIARSLCLLEDMRARSRPSDRRGMCAANRFLSPPAGEGI